MTAYNWAEVPRAELENLARIASGYLRGEINHEAYIATVERCERAAAPKLRTRAEVDAEIVDALRESVAEGTFYDCLSDDGNAATLRLRKLCAEPTAPEAPNAIDAAFGAIPDIPYPEEASSPSKWCRYCHGRCADLT